MKLDVNNSKTWIPRDVFSVYCDGDERMLAFYDKAVSKNKMMLFQFDWLAILAFPAWIGYRKQWMLLLILQIFILILTAVEIIWDVTRISSAMGPVMFSFGLMASGIYLSFVSSEYLKLKKKNHSDEEIGAKLASKGKASVSSAIFTLLGVLLLNFIFVFICELIKG